MNGDQDWPGSRWWRVDLHAHSPASHDFRRAPDDEEDWQGWIRAAAEAGLDAVAITDHNTAAAISGIQEAAAAADGPIVLPGAEITASDGVHLLVVTDPKAAAKHVDDLLARIDIPVEERGTERARSSLNVETILKKLGADPLVLAAHANGPNGLLTVHGGQQRLAVLGDTRLAAVEIDPERKFDGSWLDGSKPEVGRQVSQVWCSDAHSLEELGRRFTWIKMTRPDREGLGLALMDGADSLRPARRSDPEDPNTRHGELLIESVRIDKARFMGRREPMVVRFNPWLNTIIGGRGTGKSTLVDLCRKALRRDVELDHGVSEDEGSLRRLFDRRVPDTVQPGLEGLLTKDTRVSVVYRKQHERFDLAWSPSGGSSSITRLTAEGELPEEGAVSERFPVRIYSQKQLFGMAQNPDALLGIIDASPDVRQAERDRELGRLKSRYLSLCAQARAAGAQAGALVARKAELSDIQDKLDFLQRGGQAQQLSEYRRLRQQDETWQAVVAAVRESVGAMAGHAEALSVADLDLVASGEEDPSPAVLETAHATLSRSVRKLKQIVLEATRGAQREIDDVLTGEHVRRWRQVLKASELKFRDATAQLAEQGIRDPGQYRDLVADAARLRAEIGRLEDEETRAEELRCEAMRTLVDYRRLRTELGRARRDFSESVTGEDFRVEVLTFENDRDPADDLKEILGIDRFESDRRLLCGRILPEAGGSWGWSALDRLVEDIRRFQAGGPVPWSVEDRRFEGALKKVPPERVDRLALYAPGDSVSIDFRDPQKGCWQRLSQGSPGQQTAALLAFVLGHGEEPIILDQPEDDLDNTLICDLLVSQLKETKLRRQVIVVTHNPNVVVHGDAEFVLSLENGRGESRKACEGGLQEGKVRDEICRIMEGGREAFASRYRRIMPVERSGS